MADNNVEIERLKREIQRANSEISQLEREYETRLSNELKRIKSDFAQSTATQQKDFSSRFKKLEKSLCDAYLYETDIMKEKYAALINQVNSYERELESQIQQIIQDQEAYLNQKKSENAKVRSLAQQTIQKLNQNIQLACQVPVDLFYPHALQRYIDAGLEAENLLNDELYSLALAKADCACMFVKRLTDDTQAKVRELESMFVIYDAKIKAIDEIVSSHRQLLENGEVDLELSEIDIDYWSDLLYSDLQSLLLNHRNNIQGGVDGWLSQCQGSSISPSLLLDKEIQKLDLIPKKLNTCISYALSACDCYNYLAQIKSVADQVMTSQNYSFRFVQFGKVNEENSKTNGYAYYYDNFLVNEQCTDSLSKPDYREERILIYEKNYAGGKTDLCKLYILPIRTKDTVSLQVYIQFDTDYLPETVSTKISKLFHDSGLNIKLLPKGDSIPVQQDRQFSLNILNTISSDEKLATLTSKYSVNI